MINLSQDELHNWYPFATAATRVQAVCEQAFNDPIGLLRFLGRYTAWNSLFGSGVAALAGRIGRNRSMFLDPAEPVVLLADRSVLVASYFFDAARDEFDDRATPHRDTHRCLAQALIKGVLQFYQLEVGTIASQVNVNALLAEPSWLTALSAKCSYGYGMNDADERSAIFSSIGYHLGSELLADAEFSIIDSTLRAQQPALTGFLLDSAYVIAGRQHNAYQWLRIHSGHGDSVEADHFAWATRGARLALSFFTEPEQEALVQAIKRGFSSFAADHDAFFEHVNRP